MKIHIAGGRLHFYQWDKDQRVVLEDIEPGSTVNFARPDGGAYVVETREEDGVVYAAVPNVWLQLYGSLHVYVYCGDKQTEYHEIMFVAPRSKPDDYVYTETEILSYTALEKRVKALEANALPDDTEQIAMLAEADMLPAVHDASGAILTDETGNVILRF